MRGGVVDRIRQIRVAAIEVTAAEVVVPDAVLRDQVANAVAPGCLAELRGDAVNGEQADLVAVTEVPDGINNGKAVVRVRVGLGKIAATVLGDRNERFTGVTACAAVNVRVRNSCMKSQLRISAKSSIRKPSTWYSLVQNSPGTGGNRGRRRYRRPTCAKPEQVLAEVLAAIGAAWHGEPVKCQHGQRARG